MTEHDEAAGSATFEEMANLRGRVAAWQLLQRHAVVNLELAASYRHGAVRQAALDAAVHHLDEACGLLEALDDTLDPAQTPAGRELALKYLDGRGRGTL